MQRAVVDDDLGMLGGLRTCWTPVALRSKSRFCRGFPDYSATRDITASFDLCLGGMSGIELRRHLKSSGSKLPVIFMTAMMTTAWQASSRKAALPFAKPFASRLFEAIEKATA